nr:MAG TPA: hypothetical protein [Caudoviricetes sp.]
MISEAFLGYVPSLLVYLHKQVTKKEGCILQFCYCFIRGLL